MAQTINGTIGRTEFGNAVASAGDINGDGFGDVIVGWHLHAQFAQMNSGSAFVYLGGPMGLVDQVRCNFSALRPDEQLGQLEPGRRLLGPRADRAGLDHLAVREHDLQPQHPGRGKAERSP